MDRTRDAGAGMTARPARRWNAGPWLIALAAASMLLWIGVEIFAPGAEPPPEPGPGAYSWSALGHRALIELLRQLDRPVRVTRFGSLIESGVLVIAEPHGDRETIERLDAVIERAPNVLLVLPKWKGGDSAGQRHAWEGRTALHDTVDVARVAGAVLPYAEIIRPPEDAPEGPWRLDPGLPAPTLLEPQLLDAKGLDVLAGRDGVILAGGREEDGRRLFVLSDPDVLATHGLGRGDNAAFAVALLDRLRDGGPIVFDETFHGHFDPPGLGRLLGEWPLVLILAQFTVFAAIVLWAGAGRFGAPEEPPPELAAGKAALIGNTADLLHHAGHIGPVFRRWFRERVRAEARRRRAPAGLEDEALLAWFAARKPGGAEFAALRVAAEAAAERGRGRRAARRIVSAALRTHRWAAEETHGRS